MSNWISSQSVYSGLRQSIVKTQAELAARTTELSTGQHADVGLSLADRAGMLVSLESQKDALDTISSSNQLALTRLGTTQTILDQMQNAAQNLMNDLISDDGSTTNAGTIQSLAKTGLDAFIGQLNSTISGDFIFGGINSSTKPVTDYFGSSSANKQAVDDAFVAKFGMSQTDPGVGSISAADMQDFLDTQFSSLFQASSWTSDWSSASDEPLAQKISPSQWTNTSITASAAPFRQLAEAYTMLADLGTTQLSKETLSVVTTSARDLLGSAISGLVRLHTNAGIAQSTIEDSNQQMQIQFGLLDTQVNGLTNVDPYEVSTRISELQTQLETSYSLTSKISQLSLVNYL
jgi:flagellar hook-associated protein 3 FlgL